jgi:hypothetical protein
MFLGYSASCTQQNGEYFNDIEYWLSAYQHTFLFNFHVRKILRILNLLNFVEIIPSLFLYDSLIICLSTSHQFVLPFPIIVMKNSCICSQSHHMAPSYSLVDAEMQFASSTETAMVRARNIRRQKCGSQNSLPPRVRSSEKPNLETFRFIVRM